MVLPIIQLSGNDDIEKVQDLGSNQVRLGTESEARGWCQGSEHLDRKSVHETCDNAAVIAEALTPDLKNNLPLV